MHAPLTNTFTRPVPNRVQCMFSAPCILFIWFWKFEKETKILAFFTLIKRTETICILALRYTAVKIYRAGDRHHPTRAGWRCTYSRLRHNDLVWYGWYVGAVPKTSNHSRLLLISFSALAPWWCHHLVPADSIFIPYNPISPATRQTLRPKEPNLLNMFVDLHLKRQLD